LSKKQGRCVFCNSLGVTKQHVWPDWINSVLPGNVGRVQVISDITLERETPDQRKVHNQCGVDYLLKPNVPLIIEKSSPIGTMKVRIACRPCNSGWMSRIENAAKPVILSLMTGKDDVLLEPAAQDHLSAWAMLMSSVVEFTNQNPPGPSISMSDRSYLRQNGKPPDAGWLIGLGRFKDVDWNNPRRCSHRPFSLGLFREKPPLRIQSTTLVLGELLLHVRSSQDPAFPIGGSNCDAVKKLLCLWPRRQSQDGSVHWGTFPPMTESNFVELRENLHQETVKRITTWAGSNGPG